MSMRASTSRPRSCSGAMYVGVPMSAPSRVSSVESVSPVSNLETPKSSTLTKSRPSRGTTNRLAGFTSRWTMPASCAACSPVHACRTSAATSPTRIVPRRLMSAVKLSPWSSSITMYGSPFSSVPASNVSTMCGLPMRPAADASRRRRTVPSRFFALSTRRTFSARR